MPVSDLLTTNSADIDPQMQASIINIRGSTFFPWQLVGKGSISVGMLWPLIARFGILHCATIDAGVNFVVKKISTKILRTMKSKQPGLNSTRMYNQVTNTDNRPERSLRPSICPA